MLPSPFRRGLGLRVNKVRAYMRSTFRLRPVTRTPSKRWPLSMGFKTFGFPPICIQATGFLVFTLAGLTPAEDASLSLDAHPKPYRRRDQPLQRCDSPILHFI